MRQSLKQSAAQVGAGEIPPRSKLIGLTFPCLKSRNMGIILGKRKRRGQADEHGDVSGLAAEGTNTARLRTLLRQHFESAFEPIAGLDLHSDKSKKKETDDVIAPEPDWAGFSESEDDGERQPALVFQCSTPQSQRADFPKDEIKTFMVGVAPVYRLLKG